ncbi:MAG: S41 family peptidase [Marinifilaceae bacterium]
MYKLRILWVPILVGISIALGMLINRAMTPRQLDMASVQQLLRSSNMGGGSKLDMVVSMINNSYVDTIDMGKLEEDAINDLIKELDPHTVYIPAKDMTRVNEEMVGNFGGIGVQFYKYQDTVTVVKVVPGGPSEAAGVQDGDRIVKVNDMTVAGVNMNTDSIMKQMRGEVGTQTTLTIARRGVKEPVIIDVVRGNIPIKSVPVAYMINDTTGYIRVNIFAMTTYNEFMQGLASLSKQGMKRVIVDLRENEGGILPIATQMINEFLPADRLVLYTQGKAVPRMDYRSNGKGRYQDLPVTVLINEFSASASEIFAGAIQDNDRGWIVGRRSFGKGLVQEQRPLADGSALRLTVARYYIPSGRSIQKPYDEGKEKYYSDIYYRMAHGEFSEKDSIHFDEKLRFETAGGRTVYGGGGVMPDVFVPVDTVGYSKYLNELLRKQYLYEYTFEFMDKHREETKKLKTAKEVKAYLANFDLVTEVVNYAQKRGLKPDAKGIRDSKAVIRNRTEAFIGRHIMDDQGFYPIYSEGDPVIVKALQQPNEIVFE